MYIYCKDCAYYMPDFNTEEERYICEHTEEEIDAYNEPCAGFAKKLGKGE